MRTIGLLALTAFATGCGTGKAGDESGTPTGATDSPSTGSPVVGIPTGNGSDRSATLTGSIVPCGGGAAPADIEIRFCDIQNCRYHTTVAGDASFEFANTLVGWNSFEATDKGGSNFVTGYVPLEFATDETRDLTITLCPAQNTTALPGAPAELSMGEGLYITLSSTSIEPPLFVDPPTEASGVRMAAGEFVPTDGIVGTVVEQWFVDPFNNIATGADLPFRVDGGTLGLAAATYRIYVGSYDDFAWLDVGTVSDGDADGWFTPDAGAGLPLLGTLLLVEE